jgi:neutral ceramidase
VTILSVRDEKSRKPLAIFANYTLHYVGGVPRGQASADYFGEFARLMPSRLRAGDDFVAMMSNGASGDINNIPFLVTRPPREPYEQIRIVASKAADAAWYAWKTIDAYRPDARLGMIEREITLRLRRPTAEQIERARAIVAIKDEAELAKLPRLADVYARRTLALAEADETLSVPLQALRIGDLAVCAIPFETFVEIGLDLKKRSPFPRTMVIGVANGYNGYLPTPEQHQLGGYETWLGTNRVQKDASVILTDNLLEMLAELAKES